MSACFSTCLLLVTYVVTSVNRLICTGKSANGNIRMSANLYTGNNGLNNCAHIPLHISLLMSELVSADI